MNSNFRARLRNGDVLIGTLITIPAPEIGEIMSAIGYDWLFVDSEHAAYNARGAQGILQAADSRCPCVIRIPAKEEVWIKKALDIGAEGIIAPGVKSAEEAERIVRMCKYPPRGTRGVGIGRAHGYGLKFKEYVASANDRIAVILQVEDCDAVENIDAIVKVPDVDAVFVGPYDLSASMGKPGSVDDADVQKAVAKVAQSCKAAGVSPGIFADAAESARRYIQSGFSLVAVGTDCLSMVQGAGATLNALKK